jgi:hypothetical protein
LKTTQGALQTFMRLAVLVNLGSKRFFAATIINVRIGSVLLVQKISDYLSIKAPG